MYYEIYIDVLFLVNFMMDTFLLLLAGKILKCKVTFGRIILGALVGAGLFCVLLVIPVPSPVIKIILSHMAVNSCMVAIAFQIKKWKLFLKAILLLYICTFLMGGILQWLHPYVRTGSVFFAAAVLSYFLIKGIWAFVTGLLTEQQQMYKVILYMGNRKCNVTAWMDTGNGLRDPLSGQPVHILARALADTLFEDQKLEGIRYIPFRTIQGDGVIPVIRIEKMCVFTGKESREEVWIKGPVIGISKECIFEQEEYQMLLNPEILGGI
ncbi:MAG: sigma-E processing peptidase SpoIIGA [Hespellia sp.]|nr:sigma-E processing peptidase SpoIIGA [Hespellia sp.]